ncbi:hypothetical protein FRB94_012023 [Tulasnella sp. JGI-2019a]|nr:hypothetical protein FRB93_010431 [Tulasnella sp. JGI-2019a]KAG8992081.1 hypothetical protein FRB94_012023 [Tulasnella sp. JGI-2019a]
MPTQPTADRGDMLIRSTSSIQNLVKPQVVPSPTSDPSPETLPSVSRLNRIALLFVTSGKGDAIAVSATLRRGEVVVHLAAEVPANDPPVITGNPANRSSYAIH